jgi:hypothetical protein
MTALTDRRAAPLTWRRSAARWLPTFVGFPLGGLLSELVAGPVDGLAPALAGGAITGVVLGVVQAWSLRPTGLPVRAWTAATALGLTAGLAIGAAAVGYDTGTADLVVQGAICGAFVGAAQAVVLRPLLGRLAFLWAPALGALWALGWAITASIGVDVETQYTVFGSSGAVVVTALSAVLPALLAVRRSAA